MLMEAPRLIPVLVRNDEVDGCSDRLLNVLTKKVEDVPGECGAGPAGAGGWRRFERPVLRRAISNRGEQQPATSARPRRQTV